MSALGVRPKLPPPLEHDSQVAFFTRVDMDPRTKNLLVYAVPNFAGHYGTKGQRIYAGKRLKAEGRRKGALDINIDEPVGNYHGARIEMKRKGEKPTPEQVDWMLKLQARGYATYLCYGADQAWDALFEYMGFAQ